MVFSSVDLPQPEGPSETDELSIGHIQVDIFEDSGVFCRRA